MVLDNSETRPFVGLRVEIGFVSEDRSALSQQSCQQKNSRCKSSNGIVPSPEGGIRIAVAVRPRITVHRTSSPEGGTIALGDRHEVCRPPGSASNF